MTTISCIAYAVRTASETTCNPIKLSHAQQLTAAAFGYKSLAAFQASEEEAKTLDKAAHFVLNGPLIVTRAQELKLLQDVNELLHLFETAFKERLPAAKLHPSPMALDDYVRQVMQDCVLNDPDMSSGMAMTNNDGIGEIYLPFDEVVLAELPRFGEVRDEEFVGHVSMEPDTERPYSGHKIDVEARLIIERMGRVSISEPICEVLSARLNNDWSDDNDDDNEIRIPTVSLAQALADELGLELSEAEELVDAEPLADESDDGLLYRYVYDFSLQASPAVAEKLIAKYGSLQVEVPAWFFDIVSPLEYH